MAKNNEIDRNYIDMKLDDFLSINNINIENKEVDIINVAKSLNFEVAMMNMPSNEDGFIYVDSDKKIKIIVVNSNLSLHSKRFTIAHELAHFVLHSKDKKLFAHRDHKLSEYKNELYENEADYFAACLLMPKQTFKKIYNEFLQLYSKYDESYKENLINMCSLYFSTSPESVKRRIEELDLDSLAA